MRTTCLVALAGLACSATAARAQSLFTTFDGGNAFAGNTFNLTAQKPITIIGFDTNLSNFTGSPRNESVSLYFRNGTAVGFETTPGSWATFGTDTRVANAGEGNPSHANLCGLEFAPGQLRGMYLDLQSYLPATNQMNYTNGGISSLNSDLTLTTNTGQTSPAFFGSIANRIWNGRVYYKPTAACVPLSTPFLSNFTQAGQVFNLVATNPITITSFDMNFFSAGSNKVVAVYYKLGAAQGFENNAGAWTLLGRDSGVISSGSLDHARVRVGGLAMTPGQVYGIYVDVESFATTGGLAYADGSATYTTPDLRFSSDTAQLSPAFSGGVGLPRVWSGTIYYAPTPTVNSITPTFTSSNGSGGAFFDLIPQKDLELDGFDVNLESPVAPVSISAYYKTGTSVGFEGNAAAWTLMGTDSNVTANAVDVASPVRVRGARLKAGVTYGVYVCLTSGGTFKYLDGSLSTANSDLQFNSNAGKGGPAPFTGTTFTPRTFSGRIYYHSATCYANCDGSTSAPLLSAADFVCFLDKFRNSDPYANCDGSTGSPVLSASDFVCFLNKFRAGCP